MMVCNMLEQIIFKTTLQTFSSYVKDHLSMLISKRSLVITEEYNSEVHKWSVCMKFKLK